MSRTIHSCQGYDLAGEERVGQIFGYVEFDTGSGGMETGTFEEEGCVVDSTRMSLCFCFVVIICAMSLVEDRLEYYA